MSEIEDSQTRNRIATQLDTNFIVEAAAGTGKTTNLVNRMVALVESGACRIDQVAAVTFTRKAAAELRERFQAALRRRAKSASSEGVDAETCDILNAAADQANQAFVGTIHSFCAAMLRERPIEFGVDPGFRELDEKEDALLREQAWHENIANLIASKDPLLGQLRDLNINRSQLQTCFKQFIGFRDIQDWPVSVPAEIDIDATQQATQDYIEHMRGLVPAFPIERGTDKLMNRYEKIVRAATRSFSSKGRFFSLLEQFDTSPGETQRYWPAKELGIKKLGGVERDRWNDFREDYARPAIEYWTRYRYQFVIDYLRRAVSVYEKIKQSAGGLDFQDLLFTVAEGLKSRPELRTYFQHRYRFLLVDEFQDTDPLQAQMMMFLTSSDPTETDWTKCIPNPGSLFLVGDPKQSIYRFRRGDIVTYNKVKQIVCDHGGETLLLVKNFRSRPELIHWNNTVYQEKFASHDPKYSPSPTDMVPGRPDAGADEDSGATLSSLYRLPLPTDQRIGQVRELEAESIAKFIRHAIDTEKKVPRTQSELDSGVKEKVQPRDFLIIPFGKKAMYAYTEALERYGIPYQVSGGNPIGTNPQLLSLVDCLQTIDDPTNPVHYLSVLRNFFGFSDRDLFLFKQASGCFNYNSPIPDGSDFLSDELAARFQSAAEQLRTYQTWMRVLPYATAVSQIATHLGIISAAAITDQGDMQVGGLMKVIQWLRNQSWDFDSATDLIQFLEDALETEDTDACSALAPDGNVVRLMNLHKVKGLEAPIVFLADTSGRFRGNVECHIDRSGAEPKGYMGITIKRKVKENFSITKEVATPQGWSDHQDEEGRFLDAEHDRLLYVATTRAASTMIVSVGKNNANWSSLYPHLADAPVLPIPDTVASSSADSPVAVPADFADRLRDKWASALSPSYSIVTAKKLGLKGTSRPNWEASGDYGHQWGSAVHELLEVCMKSPAANLSPTALRLTRDYSLGTSRVAELLETVASVTNSEIWQRAQAAKLCYSELPIDTTTIDQDGNPQLIRGVIDLIFEEEDGWVIVDYKTDDVTTSQIDSVIQYYEPQLKTYAALWTEITGFKIKELGLYLTKLNRYVTQ